MSANFFLTFCIRSITITLINKKEKGQRDSSWQKNHGNLSINSDNIFPIIKKWMYSDHDIFVRELISNGCDAITKLKNAGRNG